MYIFTASNVRGVESGRLTDKVTFVCRRCVGTISTKSTSDLDFLKCPGGSLEVVDSFFYLGNQSSNGGWM